MMLHSCSGYLVYPPALPVGLDVPEPVDPSAMRSAEMEKWRGATRARVLLMIDVRSMVGVAEDDGWTEKGFLWLEQDSQDKVESSMDGSLRLPADGDWSSDQLRHHRMLIM